jgi:hypothetical protein
MSAHFVAPGTIHRCALCPVEVYAGWGELASKGWWSKHIGNGVEALKLCADCKAVIDNRREVALLEAA